MMMPVEFWFFDVVSDAVYIDLVYDDALSFC